MMLMEMSRVCFFIDFGVNNFLLKQKPLQKICNGVFFFDKLKSAAAEWRFLFYIDKSTLSLSRIEGLNYGHKYEPRL